MKLESFSHNHIMNWMQNVSTFLSQVTQTARRFACKGSSTLSFDESGNSAFAALTHDVYAEVMQSKDHFQTLEYGIRFRSV